MVFVKEVVVIDPDSKNEVELEVWKCKTSGMMIGMDSSYLDRVSNEIHHPVTGEKVTLPIPSGV